MKFANNVGKRETVEHLFFNYAKAKTISKLAPVNWDGMIQQTGSFKEWWSKHGNVANSRELNERQELTTYIMWHIWKDRNSWVFKSEKWSELEVV